MWKNQPKTGHFSFFTKVTHKIAEIRNVFRHFPKYLQIFPPHFLIGFTQFTFSLSLPSFILFDIFSIVRFFQIALFIFFKTFFPFSFALRFFPECSLVFLWFSFYFVPLFLWIFLQNFPLSTNWPAITGIFSVNVPARFNGRMAVSFWVIYKLLMKLFKFFFRQTKFHILSARTLLNSTHPYHSSNHFYCKKRTSETSKKESWSNSNPRELKIGTKTK